MNILIKLMSIVSLVIAPTLAGMHNDQASSAIGKTRSEIRKTTIEGCG